MPGNEINKHLSERHTIFQWYEEYCHFQKKHNSQPGEIKSAPATGAVYCYLGLAYSLFLLQNNVHLQEIMIRRLKNPGTFQGAYYELIIINCLIRAGFYNITFENETDQTSKHCEFSAISKLTGKKYYIEAKARSVVGFFSKTKNDGTSMRKPTFHILSHLKVALNKLSKEERLIFIELNAEPDKLGDKPEWVEYAAKILEAYESCTSNQRAYVFITNTPFHRVLTDEQVRNAILAHGLGIPDFSKPGSYPLWEIYRRKQKHIDAHKIVEAFQSYTNIPIIFEGSLPSYTFNSNRSRLLIGETYFFPEIGKENKGVIGTVTTATVMEDERKVFFVIKTQDERSHIYTEEISEEELLDYKKHPEGFFGKIQSPPKTTNDSYELFEFFVETYKNVPRGNLLKYLEKAHDISLLNKMNTSNTNYQKYISRELRPFSGCEGDDQVL